MSELSWGLWLHQFVHLLFFLLISCKVNVSDQFINGLHFCSVLETISSSSLLQRVLKTIKLFFSSFVNSFDIWSTQLDSITVLSKDEFKFSHAPWKKPTCCLHYEQLILLMQLWCLHQPGRIYVQLSPVKCTLLWVVIKSDWKVFLQLIFLLDFCRIQAKSSKCFRPFKLRSDAAAPAGRKDGDAAPVCYPQEDRLVKTWLWLLDALTPCLPNEKASAGTRPPHPFSAHCNEILPQPRSRPDDALRSPLCILLWACTCFILVLFVCLCCLTLPLEDDRWGLQAKATLSLHLFCCYSRFFCIIIIIIPIVEGNKGPGGAFEGHKFLLSVLPVVQSELVDSGAQAPAEQHRRFKQGWKKKKEEGKWGGVGGCVHHGLFSQAVWCRCYLPTKIRTARDSRGSWGFLMMCRSCFAGSGLWRSLQKWMWWWLLEVRRRGCSE